MGTFDELVRDIRAFEGRREVTRQLRARVRRPVPALRKMVKARALATLPHRGGLGAWVAGIKVSARLSLAGRGAGVRLRGGRNSRGGKSDVRAIDRGYVRAPAWGRRGDGDWHRQTVRAGFFTGDAPEYDQWRAEAVAAADDALEVIRRG